MTRDDIVCMAREAGLHRCTCKSPNCNLFTGITPTDLARFAALVAAAERAACCMTIYGMCASDINAFQIVEAIRARGDTCNAQT